MLSPEQNNLLTQTSAGTPMGELLRRYWWPIAGVSEFDEQPTKPVRLMGEDLTLYKDKERQLRPARPALPASPRRSHLWLHRGVRAALLLSRLAFRCRGQLPRAAL